jgi:BioD-like phosphotransacetylase family protein
MPFLFIGSTGDHAGQCLVTWAIARRLLEKGLRVGFFKPFGTKLIQADDIQSDPDALLFKKVLNIEEPLEMICPPIFHEEQDNQDSDGGLLGEIKSTAWELSAEKDLLIIIGSRHIYFDDSRHALTDISLISELNADMVLVHRYRKVSTTLYSVLSVNSLLGKNVKGTIINRVPNEQLDDVHEKIVPVVSQRGIRNVALLPEDPTLSLWSIREIKDIFEGEILWGDEFIDRPVGGMTVGASGLQNELRLFRRIYNKIILLGPENSVHNVSGILLTGNRMPGDLVLEAAKRSKIPLILVKEDTFSVKERLEQCTPILTPANESKVVRLTAMMDRDDFLNKLIRSIGWG